MDFKLNLKQNLKLILTQEMQLSLNILEMDTFSLINFLEKEKKSNPSIDIVYSTKSYKSDTQNLDPFNSYSLEDTLTNKLEEQIGYLKLSPLVKKTSIFIINNLTNKGYLGIPTEEIINILKISPEVLKESLEVVYSLEPVGVGAANLQECLKLQLKARGNNETIIYQIIDHHLQNLAKGNFMDVSDMLNISVDEVKNYLKVIQTLNPIPARGYRVKTSSNYITPDVEVKIKDGKLSYKINSDYLPKIYINSPNNLSSQARERIAYIIKSIEKRYDTLERIVQFLIFIQEEFFFKGKKFLKTLYLKDIAENLGLHESTISRAIKNKFLNTPQGIITFKSLLVYDDKIFKIKEIIENLIYNESPTSPLSDNQISLILLEKGYKVARRTVTKYREELGFKSSHKRKSI